MSPTDPPVVTRRLRPRLRKAAWQSCFASPVAVFVHVGGTTWLAPSPGGLLDGVYTVLSWPIPYVLAAVTGAAWLCLSVLAVLTDGFERATTTHQRLVVACLVTGAAGAVPVVVVLSAAVVLVAVVVLVVVGGVLLAALYAG